MSSYDLTDSQKEALEEIRNLMGEHFSSALFVYEVMDPNNERNSCYSYTCNCTFIQALGLASYVNNDLLNPCQPDEPS